MTFRKSLYILLAAGLFATVLGCSASNTTNKQDDTQKMNPENNWTLKDHLRRASGVRVTGTDPNTRVIIRGESSTANPTNQPLFIIDGQKAGHSYADVNDMLHQGEINYIEVVPPSRSNLYGMEGHYGVIKIFTRNQH